jgi:hypothetical protein
MFSSTGKVISSIAVQIRGIPDNKEAPNKADITTIREKLFTYYDTNPKIINSKNVNEILVFIILSKYFLLSFF